MRSISHLFHILFTARSRIQRYALPMINEEGNGDLSDEDAKWQLNAKNYSKAPYRRLDACGPGRS
jgi:hypothetical protein